jgi:hypothetical protein
VDGSLVESDGELSLSDEMVWIDELVYALEEPYPSDCMRGGQLQS